MKKGLYDFAYRLKELTPPILGAVAIITAVYFNKNSSNNGTVYAQEPANLISTNLVSDLEKSIDE